MVRKLLRSSFGRAKVDSRRLEQALRPADTSADLPTPRSWQPRRSERYKVHRFAHIDYPGGRSRQAVVVDFSKEGIKLRFDTPEDIPVSIHVRAPLIGIHRPARIVCKVRMLAWSTQIKVWNSTSYARVAAKMVQQRGPLICKFSQALPYLL